MLLPLYSLRRLALAAAALACLGTGPCPHGLGTPNLQFVSPLAGELIDIGVGGQPLVLGDVRVELRTHPRLRDLEVSIDDVPVAPETLVAIDGGYEFVTPPLQEGWHTLKASGRLGSGAAATPLQAMSGFELVSLLRPGECETLNAAHCLLPYPSTDLMREVGDETRTGWRLELPEILIPGAAGPLLDPAPMNVYDGFSPTVQVLMNFPGGVDLAASDAPVLRAPDCCGQTARTPYVDVRTQDGRSVERDSPTVLLDVETGERILHWVELDANAVGDPTRQILFLRPGKALVPGRRYVVAVRGLVDPSGAPVPAEPVFRALKQRRPSSIPAVESRRERFEDIFARLRRAGVARDDLVLAFDFVVRSHGQLTERLQHMRDDAFAFVDALPPGSSGGTRIGNIVEFGDCSDPAQRMWRQVSGSFLFPYYLTGNIDVSSSLTRMSVGPDRMPVRNGTHRFPFHIAVPCAVMRGDAEGRPLMLGHGLFGRGLDMVSGYANGAFVGGDDFPYVAFATDWRGLSGGIPSPDSLFLATQVIGIRDHRFNNFDAFPPRLKQGQTNMLLLSHMLHTGFFNRIPAFWADPSDPESGVLPVGQPGSYLGVSLGGVHGGVVAALDPYTTRYNLDVPGMNFALLEQRSTQFVLFLDLIRNVGLTNPMVLAVLLQLQHEQWASAEPAAYVRNITGLVDAPLPGVPPKQVLMTVAWLDKQVSNQATEIMARSMGLPSLVGSLQAELEEMPDLEAGEEGLENAFVMYDSGYFDVFDPAYDAVVPPLANQIPSGVCDPHGIPRLSIPAGVDQRIEFLRPGGRIFNFCDGPCDARSPEELPVNDCDPL